MWEREEVRDRVVRERGKEKESYRVNRRNMLSHYLGLKALVYSLRPALHPSLSLLSTLLPLSFSFHPQLPFHPPLSSLRWLTASMTNLVRRQTQLPRLLSWTRASLPRSKSLKRGFDCGCTGRRWRRVGVVSHSCGCEVNQHNCSQWIAGAMRLSSKSVKQSEASKTFSVRISTFFICLLKPPLCCRHLCYPLQNLSNCLKYLNLNYLMKLPTNEHMSHGKLLAEDFPLTMCKVLTKQMSKMSKCVAHCLPSCFGHINK